MGQKNKIKILSVVGARPNFMKATSIAQAIENYNISNNHFQIEHLIVHTGQHYDDQMSSLFFDELELPKPHMNLDVGSASHAQQTARIMERFEPVLLKERPDVLLVVGDVNSTIACTLVASKINYLNGSSIGFRNSRHRPLIGHVEAGLRSFDRDMPEEINRILTDHLSDFLFVSEPDGIENLKNEGFKNFLFEENILKMDHDSSLTPHTLPIVAFVGNTMIDTLLKHLQKAEKSTILNRLGLRSKGLSPQPSALDTHHLTLIPEPTTLVPYAILTLHRPSNVDDKETFKEILEALSIISRKISIIFPAHPRTLTYIKEFGFENYFHFLTQQPTLNAQDSKIYCMAPLGYLDFLCLMSNAKLVLTDSGGIQEETTVLSIPCVTIRENTERPVTVTHGTNVLAGVRKERIINSTFSQLKKYDSASMNNPRSLFDKKHMALSSQPSALNTQYSVLSTHDPCLPPLWDGKAGIRIIDTIIKYMEKETYHNG